MAFEVPGRLVTFVAVADFSASQFRFVNTDANGKASLPTAGGRAVGVRQNKPKTNEGATVMIDGISIVEAGAAVANGANVTSDAAGRAITAAAGNEILGHALETAPAAGVMIAVVLRPAGRNA